MWGFLVFRPFFSVDPLAEFLPATREAWVRFPANADSSPLGLSSAQTRTEAIKKVKHCLPVRELNPGLPRDRRGYSPVYYGRRVCLPLASLADACCCQFCCSIQKTLEETQNEQRHMAR